MLGAFPRKSHGRNRSHELGGQRGGVEGRHGGSVWVGWVRIDEAGSDQHRLDLLRKLGQFLGHKARAEGGGEGARVVLRGQIVTHSL